MTKKTYTKGTGITAKEWASFGGQLTPDDGAEVVNLLDAAATHPFQRIDERAEAVLKAAGLPPLGAVAFPANDPAQWEVVKPHAGEPQYSGSGSFLLRWFSGHKGGRVIWELPDNDGRRLVSLTEFIVSIKGYDQDSEVGYAARFTDLLETIELARQAEDSNRQVNASFDLGTLVREAQMKARWEQDVLTAQKQTADRRAGADKTNLRRKLAKEYARNEAVQLVAADTEREYTKDDMIAWISDSLERSGHHVPHPDTLWKYWLKEAPSTIPDYMCSGGRRRRT